MIRNTIRNTIQNTIRNTLGDDAFNMLDLFSGGQRGVWYDPSDLATMFQESTGRTAVTADGQPVGLMYDKSRGELFGDELITNGTFDSDISGWSDSSSIGTGSISWNSGAMQLNSDGTNNRARGSAPFSTKVGATYMLSYDATDYHHARIGAVENGSTTLQLINQTSGSKVSVFTATETASWVTFEGFNPAGLETNIDNVSVREVLGTTATQPVATKRPTYKDTPDRLEIDLVDDALLFDVPVGGIDGYMVIGTNDGTASYGVSLPAGSYELGGDYFPSNTINGFLLREGAVSKSDLAKVEKDFVSKGAKASYGDVTNFSSYWREKNEITEFPLIDTSSGVNFYFAWRQNNLTSFPLIDTSSGTNFTNAWFGNNLTSFPLINTSSGTAFQGAWANNNLTSFPLLDTSSGTNFAAAWRNNNELEDFPANMFDNCLATNFTDTFLNTGLTQSSIDGILISINSNGTSNGTFDQSGGSAPSAAGEAAIDGLVTRGWTVNVTGGYQGKILPYALFENDENGFWYNTGIN